MSETSYKQAGVDIEAGDQFVQGLKDVHQTHNAHTESAWWFAGVLILRVFAKTITILC